MAPVAAEGDKENKIEVKEEAAETADVKPKCVKKGPLTIKDMFAKQATKRKAEGDDNGPEKKKVKVKNKRCEVCRQLLDKNFITMHVGAPEKAEDELSVLFKPENDLIIQSDNYEDKPAVNLYDFVVYDKKGHLIPLNRGLVEDGQEVYFDGYVQSLLGNVEKVPVKNCLLTEWWTSGFDGGAEVIIGYSTEFADYHVKEPSEAYKPFMADIWEQSYLVKYLIEFLDANDDTDDGGEEEDGIYERFIDHLATIPHPRAEIPEFTSESVIKHAEYLVSQIVSYHKAGDEDDKSYLDSNLIKRMCELAGVQQKKVKRARQLVIKQAKVAKPKFVEATVTPLVRDVFESLFAGQMAGKVSRSKACGACENCLNPDCGDCRNCKDMEKFGGAGKSKQRCVKRKCPNMKVEQQDEELLDEKEELPAAKGSKKVKVKAAKEKDVKFEWIGKCSKDDGLYQGCRIEGEEVSVGDHILLEPDQDHLPPYVGTVVHLYETKTTPMVHIRWFARGIDTVLGGIGDKAELFFLDSCDDEPLLSFAGKAEVELRRAPDEEAWRSLGGSEPVRWERKSETSFFCSLWYDTELGRFEYPAVDYSTQLESKECLACQVVENNNNRYIPKVWDESDGVVQSVLWDGAELEVGDCVYLDPDCVRMKSKPVKGGKETVKKENIDEDMYPEYYRKSEYVKGNNFNTPDPFVVARIIKFKTEGKEIKVKVGVFYRPENTYLPKGEEDDMNLLYWSQDTDTVASSALKGRCYVRSCDSDVGTMRDWCNQGPERWFFMKAYDSATKKAGELPEEATEIGNKTKEKGSIPVNPSVKKKLVSLDIFAGCGGLSEGLHDSGVAETRWAVEVFEPAAKAFELNNKDCTVFTDDCNLLLKNVIDGEKTNKKNQKYPRRGEVDLLCGGPPCQGFSGMNRFNAGEYSSFKNSLVASYLSYAEYYRPKFFILENVKNFANYKKSMVLKSCLRALVRMGYQCTFGILQAGQFGVAQTRRRAIILAAAPGQVLPRYPEPEHVFSPQACHLSIEVDGRRFNSQTRWVGNAPRRTVTVRDTMSDLPKIKNGDSKDVAKYGGEPKSHFQRKIRRDGKELYDHVTKKMAPLIVKRFEFIPTLPGSDWRDLPNTVEKLSDGSYTQKLLYFYKDRKNGKSSTGELRGVCPCMEEGNKSCDPKDKQQNTLIPWCLPHTGNRHNNWAGLYGRVEWDGFFSTTITNPEPMGKQGRVLHPEQNRLVSVRECARSQGFPDTYRFYGSVLEKHRQIGNAVPPPLGRALGVSIGQALVQNNKEKKIKN